MSREEIFEKLQSNKEMLRKLGVRKLALFGSMARGEGTSASDLDFLVEFDSKTFDAYMDLKFFLEDLFQRSVDLVIPETIKQRLREGILKEKIHVPGL